MRHQQLSQPKCLALHRCDKMSHVTRLFLRTAGVAEADSLQYAKCKEPSRLRPRWESGCSQIIHPGGTRSRGWSCAAAVPRHQTSVLAVLQQSQRLGTSSQAKIIPPCPSGGCVSTTGNVEREAPGWIAALLQLCEGTEQATPFNFLCPISSSMRTVCIPLGLHLLLLPAGVVFVLPTGKPVNPGYSPPFPLDSDHFSKQTM